MEELNISRFWSRKTASVIPYVPGEQPRERLVKLNTNENPYPPSPAVTAALSAFDTGRLRLYPDPTSWKLRQKIGSYFNLDVGQVFMGNGSDEILAFCFQAFFNPGVSNDPQEQIVFPDISYSFYPVYARLYDIPFRTVTLLPDMRVPVDDLKAPSAGIVLANPNAPTGRALALDEIEAVADSDPDRLLIIDEAYVDFGADSAVSLLADHDNVLVVQTFSKSRSLAGLRLGFALGARELIQGLERIRDSFNSYTIDLMAQVAGEAAIEDGAYFEETRSHIIATRSKTVDALTALGFTVVPSAANFIFARHPQHRGLWLQQSLRRHGILVRHFNHPKTSEFLRISIGTDSDMQALVDSLAAILAEPVAPVPTPAL